MRKILQALAYLAVAAFVMALVTGVVWCKWEGYKQRYPNGGCLGFVTQPSR